MKLGKRNLLVVSFMLFSLFFGAGNLIFPPFMGQNAGGHTLLAFVGFFVTAVVLPVLGVVVVAEFNGLDQLGRKVGKRFAMVFTILIYLSIGPGLGIPRAASVPFEMAVAPYLPEGSDLRVFMFGYSLVFFLAALWLCLNPTKLVDRIGKVLTPITLGLLVLMFVSFLFRGEVQLAAPQAAYENTAFLQGFTDGYQTMDTIAALNFGLVISLTLASFGVKEKKDTIRYTVIAGSAAGGILALVYAMLTYMGMCSSGVYPIQGNGAWTLRCIVSQLFGGYGAVLLATTFTVACLTTCVGLINSISRYFSSLFPKVSYRKWVVGIVLFSFLVCNRGLNAILSVSVPVLDAIYPVSIVLILLGLSHKLWDNNRFVYPAVVSGTAVVSVVYALFNAKVPLNALYAVFEHLPLFKTGFGWVSVALVLLVLSVAVDLVAPAVKTAEAEA